MHDPASAHHSSSYVLHSATYSDINARRHTVYSSMNADKKASLLLARRTASEQFSYNNATCLVCKLLQQQTFGKSCLVIIYSTLWAPPCVARPLLQPPKSDVQNY
ncbi:hypothetical protein OROHE_015649 [Orobanche hederae]